MSSSSIVLLMIKNQGEIFHLVPSENNDDKITMIVIAEMMNFLEDCIDLKFLKACQESGGIIQIGDYEFDIEGSELNTSKLDILYEFGHEGEFRRDGTTFSLLPCTN